MKLSQLFAYLTYGELSNLKVGGKDCGGIYPKYSDEVVSYITQGLTALHTRFMLKQEYLILEQYSNINDYYLRTQYAKENVESTEPYKYILDTPESPFLGQILHVEKIEEVPLNTKGCEDSVFTGVFDQLRISNPTDGEQLTVIYKADHTPIDLGVNHPKDIEIDIPESLIRPLTLYVASLAHTTVGSPEGLNTGFTKMQEYEAVCLQLELQGATQEEYFYKDSITKGGWV